MAEEQTPPVTPAQTQETKPDTVDPKAYEQMKADLFKAKNQVRELSARTQAEKENILREQNRWEELAKIKDTKLSELEVKNKQLVEATINHAKFSALKEAALKAGIRPEALADLELVGTDKVQVETTATGRLNPIGVDSAIDNLKLSRPHWFQPSRTTVAGGAPNVISDKASLVTLDELVKLSNSAKKSGDYTAYNAANVKFKTQK